MVRIDPDKSIEEQEIRPEIKNAIITDHGKLTKAFEYINDLRKKNVEKMNTMMKKK
jgi:hypothetical protein